MTDIKVICYPDVLGAEWSEDGTTYQLSASQGSDRIGFGMRRDGGAWVNTNVTNPERFGETPRTVTSMREYAQRFLAAGE